MKVAITGSHGLIGTALARRLSQSGDEVVRLGRGAYSAADLEGIDAVVNLAGASIGGRRWNDAYKEELRASRLRTTTALGEAIGAAPDPPAVLLSASAVGYYGADTGNLEITEEAPAGTDFLARLCVDWEAAARKATAPGTRVVTARFGLVLSAAGGVLGRQLPLFRLGLGGRLGRGQQYQSWITRIDLVEAIVHLLGPAGSCGPYNLTSPRPVTNAELTRALGRAVHRPAGLAVPTAALRLAFGREMAELVPLAAQRVVPTRLEAAGFRFRHTEIGPALDAALSDRQ